MAEPRCVVFAANRDEVEHRIRETHRKWGYDWTEIEGRVMRPDGSIVEVINWMPMAEAMRRVEASHG